MPIITRALISVSDKAGLVPFAKGLTALGVEIISTGGTARFLNEHGIKTRSVSDVTHYPEILDGRVKTLHPKIFAGLLAVREDATHMSQIDEHHVELIDLVVVNLYPFEKTVTKNSFTHLEAIENIDIGGPSLIRASAKNYCDVAIVTREDQYAPVLGELQASAGQLSEATRKKLALAAFELTSRYDAVINAYLANGKARDAHLPDSMNLTLRKRQDLRYGENPHQRAAFYGLAGEPFGLADATQLHGKELSFNNLLDLNSALGIVQEFEEPCVVIIKHTNPCGLGVDQNIHQAFLKARATDPISAFGGIIGINREIDQSTADAISELFVEAVIAPNFVPTALQTLREKKNLRILKSPATSAAGSKQADIKCVQGGFLVQDQDFLKLNDIDFKVVSEREPTAQEWQAMRLGWRVAKWVKSNAIVYAVPDRTIGIGAGQMSRVDSSRIAIEKAKGFDLELANTAVASDAFFPFRDGLDIAAAAGATAVIQPGGSVRDAEVIAAANEHQMSMIFTGVRHFRH